MHNVSTRVHKIMYKSWLTYIRSVIVDSIIKGLFMEYTFLSWLWEPASVLAASKLVSSPLGDSRLCSVK